MTEPRLAAALIRLNADLRTIEARWALIGGLAVSARAEPRTTRDIDVAVAVGDDDKKAQKIVYRMASLGYQIDTRSPITSTQRTGKTARRSLPERLGSLRRAGHHGHRRRSAGSWPAMRWRHRASDM